jgi:hypothetical protein
VVSYQYSFIDGLILEAFDALREAIEERADGLNDALRALEKTEEGREALDKAFSIFVDELGKPVDGLLENLRHPFEESERAATDLSFTHYVHLSEDFLITAESDRGALWLIDNTDTTVDVASVHELAPVSYAWVETREQFERLFEKAKLDGLSVELTVEQDEA